MTTASSAPSFLIIGAARSGSSLLAQALATHPRLDVTDPKEPNFLAAEAVATARGGPGDEAVARNVTVDEARWRALFAGRSDGVLVAEASVSTMYFPEFSLRRIESCCPDVAAIVVLRAPWDRARSAWAYQSGRGFETLEFADALAAEPERIADGYQFIWHYARQGLYADQLAPFLERLGDRLHVVEYERLVDDRSGTLAQVHDFLGVEQIDVPGLGRVNASSDPRFATVRRLMATAYGGQRRRRLIRGALPPGLRRSVMRRFERTRPLPPFPDGFVASFDDDRRELAALLGDRAPSWTEQMPAQP